MDVICEQCGAEYEFDETLLSDKGTTVKCSACAHVFRVMPQNRDVGRAPLKLRPASGGRELTLGSLRDLQQRIAAGEVSLDDEIGREGHPFRHLRDIPELKNFFARAAERTTAQPAGAIATDGPPTVRRPTGTLMGAMRPPGAVAEEPSNADPKLTPTVPAPPGSQPESDPALPPPPATPRVTPSGAREERAPQPAAKRTMMGVGPSAGPRPAAAPASGSATLGPVAAMVKGGSAKPARGGVEPTASAEPTPDDAAHMPTLLGTPASALGAPSGSQKLEPSAQASAAEQARAAFPSSSERPLSAPVSAPAPASHRAPPSGLPGFQLPAAGAPSARPAPVSSYAPPSGSVGPLSPARSAQPPTSVGPSGRVQLYLADDEAAPDSAIARASSKLWLVALVLVILGGAGWFGVHHLTGPGQGAEGPVAEVAPDPTPSPSPAPTGAEVATTAPAAPEPSAPTNHAPPAAPTPPAPAPTPATAAPQAANTDKPKRREATEESAPAPKPERAAEAEDYGQLVARAAQLEARGDHAGATKVYRAALGLRPTGAEANSGLGFSLLAAGKASEALPLFDRAANSGFADAHIGLGDAYRKLGQPSSAIEAYRTYLERMPDGARAAHARQWIEKLGQGGGGRATEPAPTPSSEGYRPAGELEQPTPTAPVAEPTPTPAPAPAPTPSAPDELPERPVAPSEPTP